MKVLTIKQPWANLILSHGKDIENRSWNTKYRGRFYIHAAKKEDKTAMKRYTQAGIIHPDDIIHGAIIGSVELVDVVRNSESVWFHGPVGFVLKNPRAEEIRFVRGKLNFWEVKQ